MCVFSTFLFDIIKYNTSTVKEITDHFIYICWHLKLLDSYIEHIIEDIYLTIFHNIGRFR